MTTEIKYYDIKKVLEDNGVPEEEHVKLQSLYNEKMHQIFLILTNENSRIVYTSLRKVKGVEGALEAIFDLTTIRDEEIQKLYEETINITKGII